MKTFALFAAMLINLCAFAQLTPKQQINPGMTFRRTPISKAEVDAVKKLPTNQRIQNIVLDYDALDEDYTVNVASGVYERFIWDLNTRYTQNDPNRFALTWGVAKFDTIVDALTGISYPRNSTYVRIDSIETFITHENIMGTRDTIKIEVYAFQGTAGLQVDANENIVNTVLWDTLIITQTSLTPSPTQLGVLTVKPNLMLTYPNNRFLVGVHFYGDTANHTFTILAGYGDRCGSACFAYPSIFNLNSLWRMIAWAGGTNLTGINSIAYNCDGDANVGEPAECEEFPIQNFAITPYVTINPALSATAASPVSKCPNQNATLSVIASGGTPPYTYSWSPTTGLSSPFSASTTTTVNTNTTYTVTVGHAGAGTVTRTVTVNVNGITVNAGADRQIGCGQTVSITPTLGGITTGATYQWSNGRSTLTNSSVGAGTYTITVTNSSGCTSSDVVIVSVPNISQTLNFTTNLTNNTGCRNSAVQFTNTSTRQNGWNWSWNFGNGNFSTSANPSYTYTNSGAYLVTLQADSAGCSVQSVSKTITINTCGSGGCTPNSSTGTAGFTPQWQCLNCAQQGVNYAEVIHIENFDSIGGIVIQSLRIDSITGLPSGLTYTLNPANGVLPGGATACVDITGNTFVPTGNYQVKIYVTVTMQGLGSFSGEIDEIIQNLVDLGILFPPVPDFSYFIRVIQQGGNCTLTGCGSCLSPDATFSYTSNGLTLSFLDFSTNTPNTWAWNFGDGSTSSQQSLSHTFPSAGTYNVCLTAANSCGSDQQCQSVTVSNGCSAPAASFTSSSTGLSVNFTDISANSPTSWSWTFGDGSTSSQRNPSHTYNNAGTYNVCLTSTNSCGNNTSCQNVTVTCTAPSASFSSNASGTSVSFTNNSTGGTSWSWTFGDGGTSTQQNPQHTYNNSGTYNVCLTATNSCGNNTSCQNVTVTCVAPAASFTSSATGTSVAFTDVSNNGPTSWAWTFGDGQSSNQQNPSHTFTNSGTYNVCLTATNSCGNNTSCQNVTVTCVNPSAGFSYTSSGTTLTFTDNTTGGASSWSWTFGDGGSSTQQNPSHTFATAGNYNVCLTATNSCGNNTSCQTLTVTCTAPAASFTYSGSGTTIDFTDNTTNGASTWAWTFGDGGSSTLQNPSHTYSATGSFNVCLTATNSCGNNTSCQTISVTCNTAPVAAFESAATGLTVAFADSSTNGPSSWSWTFGNGQTSNQQNPSHTYANAGTYTVCLSVSSNCGSNQTCQTVTVYPVGIAGIHAQPLRIYPNPFSEVTTIEIPEVVNGTYDLRVLDLLGNEVRVLQNRTDKTIQLQRDNLANGVYFIEVRSDRRYFGKVVLK